MVLRRLARPRASALLPALALSLSSLGCGDRSDSGGATRAPGSVTGVQAELASLVPVSLIDLPAGRDDGDPPRVVSLSASSTGGVLVSTTDGGVYAVSEDRGVVPLGLDPSADRVVWGAAALEDGRTVLRSEGGRSLTVEGRGATMLVTGPGAGLGTSQMVRSVEGGRLVLGLSPIGWSLRQPTDRPLAVVVDPEGQPLDTIRAPAELARRCGAAPDSAFAYGRFADIRWRYQSRLEWTVLPSGTPVVGCTGDFPVRIGEEREGGIRVGASRARLPIGPEERQNFRDAWAFLLQHSREGPRPEWSWGETRVPDEKPAYQRLLADGAEERFWVWISQPSQRHAAPPQWPLVGGPSELWVEPQEGLFEVYASDGTAIGSIAVPRELDWSPQGTSPDPLIRADTVWWAVVDSAGTWSIARTEVDWTPGRTGT